MLSSLAGVLAAVHLTLSIVAAQSAAAPPIDDPDRPDLGAIIARPPSVMAPVIDRYVADLGSLDRKYPISISERRAERLDRFRAGWIASLDALDFDGFGRDAQVDWLLLRNEISGSARREALSRSARLDAARLLPDPASIVSLIEAREDPLGAGREAGDRVAARFEALRLATTEAERALRAALADQASRPSAARCRLALLVLQELRRGLSSAHRFRSDYDPTYTWWTEAPWSALTAALDGFERVLREEGVGQTPTNPDVIVGTPIGREALLADLAFEWIAYTPEELLAVAEREFAWCEAELATNAEAMGFGFDWKRALEEVKLRHVAPGEQPALIRGMADEAVAFLRERDLITVPALADETWRMEMMSPARQRVTPFFTGGEIISVAFPTDDMSHDQKLMTLRGNNRHFARATVFHELIPGHHLQQFIEARERVYRVPFRTPFWIEGWALHWEMLMWDEEFQTTPEDRIGALFWRAHRAARIVFSIRYHLGLMSAEECVSYLVDRVGHERANAEGEVRRAVSGDYAPLYQVAYMIGGLQLRSLHREMVLEGGMTNRAFHDAVLREANIPFEFVRMLLTDEPLRRDLVPSWRFTDVPVALPASPATEGGQP